MERKMRHGILALTLLLAAQTVASAQSSAPMLGENIEPVRFAAEPIPLRTWASGEYLAWWVRGQPAPGPLVTTGDPASSTAGFLSDPSTRVLFGDRNIGYGTFAGARFAIGRWLDDDSITGIEFTGFYLQPRATSFQAASDATGLPILAMLSAIPEGGERALYIASQVRNVHGSINVTTSSQLLGGELNGVFNAWRMQDDVLELLVGFRYLDLQENLQTSAFSSVIGIDFSGLGNDSFNTRNHFYGAQVGARWTGGSGRLSTTVTGLVGLGATNQVVAVGGTTTFSGTAVPLPAAAPGFLYSQPTNIGQVRHTAFSAVPQVQIKLGYDLLRNVRLTLGYDFLCWTNVVRASQQIDPVVNTTQAGPEFYSDGQLKLVGQASPMPQMNRSNFWAQGFSGGLELRW